MNRVKACTSLDGKPTHVCGSDCLSDCHHYTDDKSLEDCKNQDPWLVSGRWICDRVIDSECGDKKKRGCSTCWIYTFAPDKKEK